MVVIQPNPLPPEIQPGYQYSETSPTGVSTTTQWGMYQGAMVPASWIQGGQLVVPAGMQIGGEAPTSAPQQTTTPSTPPSSPTPQPSPAPTSSTQNLAQTLAGGNQYKYFDVGPKTASYDISTGTYTTSSGQKMSVAPENVGRFASSRGEIVSGGGQVTSLTGKGATTDDVATVINLASRLAEEQAQKLKTTGRIDVVPSLAHGDITKTVIAPAMSVTTGEVTTTYPEYSIFSIPVERASIIQATSEIYTPTKFTVLGRTFNLGFNLPMVAKYSINIPVISKALTTLPKDTSAIDIMIQKEAGFIEAKQKGGWATAKQWGEYALETIPGQVVLWKAGGLLLGSAAKGIGAIGEIIPKGTMAGKIITSGTPDLLKGGLLETGRIITSPITRDIGIGATAVGIPAFQIKSLVERKANSEEYVALGLSYASGVAGFMGGWRIATTPKGMPSAKETTSVLENLGLKTGLRATSLEEYAGGIQIGRRFITGQETDIISRTMGIGAERTGGGISALAVNAESTVVEILPSGKPSPIGKILDIEAIGITREGISKAFGYGDIITMKGEVRPSLFVSTAEKTPLEREIPGISGYKVTTFLIEPERMLQYTGLSIGRTFPERVVSSSMGKFSLQKVIGISQSAETWLGRVSSIDFSNVEILKGFKPSVEITKVPKEMKPFEPYPTTKEKLDIGLEPQMKSISASFGKTALNTEAPLLSTAKPTTVKPTTFAFLPLTSIFKEGGEVSIKAETGMPSVFPSFPTFEIGKNIYTQAYGGKLEGTVSSSFGTSTVMNELLNVGKSSNVGQVSITSEVLKPTSPLSPLTFPGMPFSSLPPFLGIAFPPLSLGGGGGGRKGHKAKGTRKFQYTPTVLGVLSGKTLKRIPKRLGVREQLGIRYPLETINPRKIVSKRSLKNPIMDSMRRVLNA